MPDRELELAVDALLMAFTAAQTGGDMGTAVANVYADRFEDMQVDASDCECRGDCPVVGRATIAAATEGGRIIAEHLALELRLLGALIEATGNPDYQALLQQVLDEAD
jgi:hypothetical protein